MGQISAHIDGTVPQVLALIDQKPLNYPTRFQIRSATAKGNAAVDLDMRVPMLHDIKVADVGISIHAATNNLALALSDHLVLSNGSINFDVDNQTLKGAGTVSLGLFDSRRQLDRSLCAQGSDQHTIECRWAVPE